MTPPRILTIAGSDSGGGAGIQADLKTFEALGGFGTSAITAITAQNTVGVRAIHHLPADLVVSQVEAVFDDIGADAIKVGMLGSSATIAAVADVLRNRPPIPLVLDPVMVAKSDDALLDEEAMETMIAELLPLATLVTPNLPEAERLATIEIEGPESIIKAARAMVEGGASAVLVKGGHAIDEAGGEVRPSGKVVDWLFDGERAHRFENARLSGKSRHGTGCTLSSAIAVELASGVSLVRAVELGIEYTRRCIKRSASIGGGHPPLNHSGRYRFTERE